MLRFVCLLAFPCLIAGAVISSADTGNENFRTARKEDGKSKMTKFLEDCLNQEYSEMATCFGVKTVAILDRASRMSNINVFPGVAFVADSEELQRSGRALLTEEEIENSISADPKEKGSKLMDLLFDSVSQFFNTHSLQLRIPKSSSLELQRALDEGRAKIKKKLLPFLGVLAVKIFALLPLLLGAVGFLALKALLIGKIALVIAGILALQKYSSTGNFGGWSKLTDGFGSAASSYSPVSSPGGPYYRRSIEDQTGAQHLAYSAQVPQSVSPTS